MTETKPGIDDGLVTLNSVCLDWRTQVDLIHPFRSSQKKEIYLDFVLLLPKCRAHAI